MNGKKKKTNRVLIRTVALVLCIAFFGITSTLATESTFTNTLTNIFSFRKSTVNVFEPGIDPDSVEWGEDTKPVYLTVPATAAASVVRATIFITVTDNDGNIVRSLSSKLTEPDNARIVMGDFTLVFDEEWSIHWMYSDGMFYLRKVLEPGTTSDKLLSGVVLTSDTPEKRAQYSGFNIDVNVLAESIQANNSAPSEWNVSVDSEGTVMFS